MSKLKPGWQANGSGAIFSSPYRMIHGYVSPKTASLTNPIPGWNWSISTRDGVGAMTGQEATAQEAMTRVEAVCMDMLRGDLDFVTANWISRGEKEAETA